MNVIQAIADRQLFRPFVGDDLTSWNRWGTALRVLYGLPVKSKRGRELVKRATGREADTMPKDGFNSAIFLCGRRSGKSKISALVACFEAILSGNADKLTPGEVGVIPIIAPSKRQAKIIHTYCSAIFNLPLFKNELVRELNGVFELRNNVSIEILAGDWRSVRGHSLLCAIVDELAFFGIEEATRSDQELIRAIRPGLANTNGKLLCISSPYGKRGFAYNTHKRHHGNPKSKTLVWQAPSRMMNPTLPQSVIDDAMLEDPAAARSEYLAEFRDDISAFITREVVEKLVAKGVQERLPRKELEYFAFVDMSGGRGDDSVLAIGHLEKRVVVLDSIRRFKPPFSPDAVINEMCGELRRYYCRSVVGDNYAAEFVKSAFESNGIFYEKSELPKSALYIELLPRLCSGEIVLLDMPILIDQISNLERRTRAGGRDVIDHPSGQGHHDDIANAVAGVAYTTSKPQLIVG